MLPPCSTRDLSDYPTGACLRHRQKALPPCPPLLQEPRHRRRIWACPGTMAALIRSDNSCAAHKDHTGSFLLPPFENCYEVLSMFPTQPVDYLAFELDRLAKVHPLLNRFPNFIGTHRTVKPCPFCHDVNLLTMFPSTSCVLIFLCKAS